MKMASLKPDFKALTRRSVRPMSRDKSDTLLLLATCALVLIPHMTHLPGWILPTCGILLGWRAWITFRGNRMPSRWLLLPVAALTMAGVLLTYRTFFGRDAGVAMLTLLLALKLLEMHAKRDLFVVLFLNFFLILANFFYSQSIGTAVLTLAALIAILTTQLSFQYTGAVPPLKKRLQSGVTILALAAPVTLVLFMLFPRIQGPLWGMPSDAQAGRTGVSDTMSPGNISRLALSETIAFRVKFSASPPPQSKLYWRGVVLGDYDGRTWTQLKLRSGMSRPPLIQFRDSETRYQITLEPHNQRWLYALDVPGAVPQLEKFSTSVNYDLQIVIPTPVTDRVRYDAVSHLDVDLHANESPTALRRWLVLPPGFNPDTLNFATQLRTRTGSDIDTVNAALRFFREQNFRYTLEPPLLGRNAVDEFLFTTRAGFCEHYSSAFVVMMRAAGIPARVVVGYQGGEINPADGYLEVRQSDAHAWTEVWIANRGWIRVDPTAAVAPNRIEQNLATVIPRTMFGGLITLDNADNPWIAALTTLRNRWNAINNGWNQWVLNYTPERQRKFLEWLGFEQVDWRTMTALMIVLAIAAVAVVVFPLILQQRKRDPLIVVYDALCSRMARKGLPRLPHEGPRAYCERLTAMESPLSPEQKAALARFLKLYETVRYGAIDEPPAIALSKLKSLLAECR
ncbi:MAG TPA: DUF3488 and transglutaminase-like domain-containing protein [Noviherbaspirillum sp.]